MRSDWWAALFVAGVGVACATQGRAADVILNEYNAVAATKFLQNQREDTFWGRIEGNGGDWFELVVITDHLDMRGWTLTIDDDTDGEDIDLVLTDENVWADLRSGTLVTISEELGNNVSDYDPTLNKWWLNVKAASDTNGRYITASNFRGSSNNWRLTIRNAAGVVVFGPAGEGVNPQGGIGSDEVFKLEEDPSASVTPFSNYTDGSSSTFGASNVWNGGANEQDFSALRNVLLFFQITDVRINEVFSHSDFPLLDYAELVNMTNAPIDIGGWFLSDDENVLTQFRIPDGTTILANEYITFEEDVLGFAFSSSEGDELYLSVGDAEGNLTGGLDFVVFEATANGVSLGRWPVGTGPLVPMIDRTPGAANGDPLVGPIVISEIMYHPRDAGGVTDPAVLEFIELYNITRRSSDLFTIFDELGTTEPWKLTSGVSFEFSTQTTIGPRGFLIVVGFDPALDPDAFADFRDFYSLDDSVAIVGPFDGRLSNGGETLRLRMPDTPRTDQDPFVPYPVSDRVDYLDTAPWPTEPDGNGPSLERLMLTSIGNDAANWAASLSTNGSPGALRSADVCVDALDCHDGDDRTEDACIGAICVHRVIPDNPDDGSDAGGGSTGGGMGDGGGTIPSDPQIAIGRVDANGHVTVQLTTPDGAVSGIVRIRSAAAGSQVVLALVQNADAPGRHGSETAEGLAADLYLLWTVVVSSDLLDGLFTGTLEMIVDRALVDALGVRPDELELHVLNETVTPPAWERAGQRFVGRSTPTPFVADYGYQILADGAVSYWVVREQLSAFAIGQSVDGPQLSSQDMHDPPDELTQVESGPDDLSTDSLADDSGFSPDAVGGLIDDEDAITDMSEGTPPGQTSPPPAPGCGGGGATCGASGPLSMLLILIGLVPGHRRRQDRRR